MAVDAVCLREEASSGWGGGVLLRRHLDPECLLSSAPRLGADEVDAGPRVFLLWIDLLYTPKGYQTVFKPNIIYFNSY